MKFYSFRTDDKTSGKSFVIISWSKASSINVSFSFECTLLICFNFIGFGIGFLLFSSVFVGFLFWRISWFLSRFDGFLISFVLLIGFSILGFLVFFIFFLGSLSITFSFNLSGISFTFWRFLILLLGSINISGSFIFFLVFLELFLSCVSLTFFLFIFGRWFSNWFVSNSNGVNVLEAGKCEKCCNCNCEFHF